MSINLFLIKNILSNSVIDEMIYAAALVFKILVIYRLDFYLKFAEKNLELQSYTMKFRGEVNSAKNIFG